MKRRSFLFSIVVFALIVMPLAAGAVFGQPPPAGGSPTNNPGAPAAGTVQSLIVQIGEIVSSLIPIAFGVGVLAFFWGMAKYIFAAGNEDSKEQGKQIMIWGVIAIFVMSAIFGIVILLRNTLGVGNETTIDIPHL